MKEILLLTLILIFANNIYPSGWVGAGGGLKGYESNPWFIGKMRVKYCLEVDPLFPIDKKQVQQEVLMALKSYRKFILDYDLPNKKFNTIFPDGKSRGIDLTYQMVENCQGEGINLKFLIGQQSEQIKEILKGYPPNTLALAQITDYDFKNYTQNTKGIIWVRTPQRPLLHSRQFPPYDVDKMFRIVLLHEIGHTLGLGHINDHSALSGHIFEWMSLFMGNDQLMKVFLNKITELDSLKLIIPFGRKASWNVVNFWKEKVKLKRAHSWFSRKSLNNNFKVKIEMDKPKYDHNFPLVPLTGKIIFSNGEEVLDNFPFLASFQTSNKWYSCKIKLSWKDDLLVPFNKFMIQGCLDPLSSESIAGIIKDEKTDFPIGSFIMENSDLQHKRIILFNLIKSKSVTFKILLD